MTKLRVSAFAGGLSETRRKTRWIISARSPKRVEDLTFFSRDASGRAQWWDVAPPKTDYWHAHEVLGRAYALEILDLLNNPETEENCTHVLRCVLEAILRNPRSEGMVSGFNAVISEWCATGTANR